MLAATRDDSIKLIDIGPLTAEGDAGFDKYLEIRGSMIREGRLFYVPSRTRVVVLEEINLQANVKVLEGEHAGRTGWIFAAWVKGPRPAEGLWPRPPSSAEKSAEIQSRERGIAEPESSKSVLAPTTTTEPPPQAPADREPSKPFKSQYDVMVEQIEQAKREDQEKMAGRAQSLLRSAQNLERKKKPAAAIDFYRKIVRDYPETPQVKVATERIKALGGK